MKHLWKFLRYYRSGSLLVRNFVIIFGISIFSLVLIYSLVNQMSRGLIDNSVLEMNATVVDQSVEIFDSILDESTRMGAYLLNDNNAVRFMFLDNPDINMPIISNLTSTARTFPMIYNYIHSVYIYSETSDTLVSSNHGFENDFKDRSWLPAYRAGSQHQLPAISRTGPNDYPYFMSVIIPYYFYVTEKKGAVIINIDMEKLDRSFSGDERFNHQQIFIISAENDILYCKDKSLLASRIEDALPVSLSDLENQTVTAEGADGTRNVITTVPLKNRGWQLVSVLPLTVYDAHFDEQSNTMFRLILRLIAIGIATSVILAVKTYAPVKNVIIDLEEHGIKKNAPHRNFSEIEHIKSLVVNTSIENESMKIELEKRMALLEEAQAGALQAQITPHFLSNTLDSIRWGAVRLGNGENDVSRMIYLLSVMFRVSLDMKNTLVSVADEIEHGKLYIEIMAYRYTNLISVEWNIDVGVKEMTALKLSFQPILENAIYHGIKPKKAAGKITVTGFMKNNCVHIRFFNDGIGLAQAEADYINARMNTPDALLEEHIGMQNVNQRLKLAFGTEYGASISYGENGGTEVELKFPAILLTKDKN